MPFQLNDDEKMFLLRLARRSIKNFLSDRIEKEENYFSDNLKTESGAFVTLHKHGELRGCIGYVVGFKPLQDAIQDLAVSAAFNDPRFPPLSKDEFELIDLEISVLTPLEKVHSIKDIQIGRDGLMVKRSPFEGLLLPQVATEYNWDVETFLSHTCRKAGLPAEAWKDGAIEIWKFSAIIFSEKEFGLIK